MSDTQSNGMTVAEHSQTRPRTADGRDIETVDVDGGALVFARCEERVGRELIGFADVESTSDLRRAVAARGLGHGAVDHLPIYDAREVFGR